MTVTQLLVTLVAAGVVAGLARFFFVSRPATEAVEHAGVQEVRVTVRGGRSAEGKTPMRNIRQNLAFAFGCNALGIPLAAGVPYPVVGLLLNPMIAAAAMAASSLSVVSNANRLRRFRPPAAPPAAGGSRPSAVKAPDTGALVDTGGFR